MFSGVCLVREKIEYNMRKSKKIEFCMWFVVLVFGSVTLVSNISSAFSFFFFFS